MIKQVVVFGTIIFLFFNSWGFGEGLRILKEYKGTVTGTLEYARMQYFLHTQKGEAYCIFYDEEMQENQLQNLSGQTVKLEGEIKVFKDGGKCIDITPKRTQEPTNLPDSLTTVVGELGIEKNEDEVPVVKLNGDTIYVGEGGFSLHFEKLFDLGSYQSILVADSTGGTACPVSYVFIMLRSNKSFSVTKSFGNCSDIPKIQQQGKKVTLSFPPFGSAPAEKWIYNDGKLNKTVP